MAQIDSLMSPDDAAEILKVSRRSIDKFLRDGSLKGSKVGRFWRIKKEDLYEFIDVERGTGTIRIGTNGVHASGHIREIFYGIVENINEDKKWLESEKNRAHTRRVAGRMWACTDILPGELSEMMEDISVAYLNDFERGKKIGNCSQLARFLMDILDSIEPR